MKKENFEVIPYSWYKRRTPTFVPPSVTYVEVIGFKKEHGQPCEMKVKFDDGLESDVNASVSVNQTYGLGGTVYHHGWHVTGTTYCGRVVSVRLVE